MSDSPTPIPLPPPAATSDNPRPFRRPRASLLPPAAIAIGLAALGLQIFELLQSPPFRAAQLIPPALTLLGLLVVLAVLSELSAARRTLQELQTADWLARHGSAAATGGGDSSAGRSPSGGSVAGRTLLGGDTNLTGTGLDHWPEAIALLRDIRDHALLSDAQRAEKLERIAADDIARGGQRIDSLLEAGQFVAALQIVLELKRRFPTREELGPLGERVESARARGEKADVAAMTRRVDELISMSAWERAVAAAAELLETHPGSAEAEQLVARVERERDLFLSEQKQHMAAEVHRLCNRKRWREALAATRTFIERFPKSTDAETFRMQLPTLTNNAEVEDRQAIEAEITEMAKHARYIEAYNLALHLIQTYPDSAHADALRSQLPRLKDLAHNPNATPARVRIEQ